MTDWSTDHYELRKQFEVYQIFGRRDEPYNRIEYAKHIPDPTDKRIVKLWFDPIGQLAISYGVDQGILPDKLIPAFTFLDESGQRQPRQDINLDYCIAFLRGYEHDIFLDSLKYI